MYHKLSRTWLVIRSECPWCVSQFCHSDFNGRHHPTRVLIPKLKLTQNRRFWTLDTPKRLKYSANVHARLRLFSNVRELGLGSPLGSIPPGTFWISLPVLRSDHYF